MESEYYASYDTEKKRERDQDKTNEIFIKGKNQLENGKNVNGKCDKDKLVDMKKKLQDM